MRGIENPRDRALFWLIYDGGLRCQEALTIDIDDISWSDRSILLHDKGGRLREMFFSRTVGTLLDKYLATRGSPTSGPLFVTHRKARLPRRADLTADGYVRLPYRQADTLWKAYTPEWDLLQLRPMHLILIRTDQRAHFERGQATRTVPFGISMIKLWKGAV